MRCKRLGFFVCGLILAWASRALSAPDTTLDAFAYPNRAEARATWRAMSGSPEVDLKQPGAAGLVLTCPFNRDRDRVYWDRTVSLNLSRWTSFVLDVDCADPEALRSFGLYFRSGDGWYVWNRPLSGGGRQRRVLLKSDFSVEGKPTGWHHITAIRLSPWRGASRSTQVVLYGLTAHVDPIVVVSGSSSAKGDAATAAVARRTAQRVSRWLKELGVSHRLVDDDDAAGGALGEATIAILPYNPWPTARTMKALQAFVRGGGKLIVCYSADPALADLLGFKLGNYIRATAPGRWSAMEFETPMAWCMPRRVLQKSSNLMPAYPAAQDAKVLAWWTDEKGKRAPEPAWVVSERGAWMSHVLLEDDPAGKLRLMGGLLGQYDPSLRPAIARRNIELLGRIDSYRSLDDAIRSIGAAPGAKTPRVRELLKTVAAQRKQLAEFLAGNRYAEAVEMAEHLRTSLEEAYARIQKPVAGEFRGVWDARGTGPYPGDWTRTCRELREAGFTALLPNVVGGGAATYASKAIPRADAFQRHGDQIATCVRAAREQGLEVHAWIYCWFVEGAPNDWLEQLRREERLQVDANGKTLPWLSPSHPENQRLLLEVVREIAAYNVDGIHLDYIRYPGAASDVSPAARRAFEAHLGRRVPNWPKAVIGKGPLAEAFCAWRAEQITDMVRKIRAELKKTKPEVRLSAAVFGLYPGCLPGVAQDWGRWLKEGLVDFVTPMNYATDLTTFVGLTRPQLAMPGAPGRVYPGLGVSSSESRLSADGVIEQIVALRRLGAKGFVLFRLDRTLIEQVLPYLRLGVTAAP